MLQLIPFNLPRKIAPIVLLLCFQSFIALAQNLIKVNGADTTRTEEVIEAVPLSNIGSETESTLSRIREIKNMIIPLVHEAGTDSVSAARLEELEKLKKTINLEDISQKSMKENESLKTNLTQWRGQLEGWRNEYTRKSEEAYVLREELNAFKNKWQKTRDLQSDEKLPKEVSSRINTNLTEVNALIREVNNRINDLLSKQDKLTGGIIIIDDVLNAISSTEVSYREQIFSIDSPPIWHIFYSDNGHTQFKKHLETAIEMHKMDFLSFIDMYATNIYLHLSFFLLLLFMMFFLKAEVKKWSDEKKDQAIGYSLYLISNPVSSSALVAILASELFYDEAPGLVLGYFNTLLIWPLITLLPGLLKGVEKKYFYYSGLLFIVAQLSYHFEDVARADRLLLMLLQGGALVLLISLLQKRDFLMQSETKLNWSFSFLIMKIAAFLLAIALLCNVFGNVILSTILTEGSLIMVFGGVIIYASALTIKSLFALLLQHDTISQLNMIQHHADDVKRNIFKIIRIVAVFYWIFLTFSGYEIFEPVYDWLAAGFIREWQIGSVSLSIGSLLAFFVTLWIALTISKLIRFILQDEILTHFQMPRGVPGAISMIVRLILLFIGFILAFGAAKIDMNNIAIIFGALGVGIGFGLQNIFNNLVSGLILVFERPIQVGDIIQVGNLNLMGEVKEIGIRASVVRTFDGAEVVVPNGNLISNELINWTLSDQRRRHEIIVGVAYGTDTKKVLEILNNVVLQQENVLKNPAPSVFFLEFGDSSLNFRVLFWTHFDHGLSAKSAVSMAIDEAFKKEGIEIPFPQRDLHLRSVSDKITLHHNGEADNNAIGKARRTSKKPANGNTL
jgi:potassium-dependent mechanosensitive channel